MKEYVIKVRAPYLVLPVSDKGERHHLCIFRNGEMIDDFALRLDYDNPVSYSFYPIGEWMGEEISVGVKPDDVFYDRQTFSPVHGGRGEEFRPYVHFAPEYGWSNDPNGLLKYTSPVTGKTVWHLYYQQNPYDWVWGNLHWGHAVSEDLVHWKHLPTVLYPDSEGTMFSGSAVIDKENRTGLKTGKEDLICVFYTCAGGESYVSDGKRFTQCMAYSNDGGMTFKKYENNPVVNHIKEHNCDPNVIWCRDIGKYVMVLYLDAGEYALLVSDNLTDWEEKKRFMIEGEREVPDFFPLNPDGDPEKRKWVITGSSNTFLVGEWKDGEFEIIQETRRMNYGYSAYAAQTFTVDDGEEIIQMSWNRWMNFGNATFCGRMGFPCRLLLAEDEGGYALRAEPIDTDFITADVKTFENAEINGEGGFLHPLCESAYDVSLKLKPEECGEKIKLSFFGQDVSIEFGAENLIKSDNAAMPFGISEECADIRFIVDKGAVELFANGGRSIMTVPWTPDFRHGTLEITSERGKSIIRSLTIKRLQQ